MILQFRKIIVGITGASGTLYGIYFLKACKMLKIETHLIISDWGKQNIEYETNYSIVEVEKLCSGIYDYNDLAAPFSSGSFKHDGMVIVPCSMKTVGVLANSISDNLIARAADVSLKEGRSLLISPREAPLTVLHLENLLKLAKAGVIIFPPMPPMYSKPKEIDEMIFETVGRMLERMGFTNDLYSCWDGK